MDAKTIVRDAMEKAGVSQNKLAGKIGLKTQQGMRNLLMAKHGMRIDNFIKIMNALGYDVLVKNRVNDETITVEVGSCDTDTDE